MSDTFAIYVLQPNVFAVVPAIVSLVQRTSTLPASWCKSLNVVSEFIHVKSAVRCRCREAHRKVLHFLMGEWIVDTTHGLLLFRPTIPQSLLVRFRALQHNPVMRACWLFRWLRCSQVSNNHRSPSLIVLVLQVLLCCYSCVMCAVYGCLVCGCLFEYCLQRCDVSRVRKSPQVKVRVREQIIVVDFFQLAAIHATLNNAAVDLGDVIDLVFFHPPVCRNAVRLVLVVDTNYFNSHWWTGKDLNLERGF